MIVIISNHIYFVWLLYTIIINCLIVKYQLIKKRNKPCKIEVTVDVKREETELLFSIIHREWREATTDDEDIVSPWEDGTRFLGGALNGMDRERWLGEEERGGSGGDVEKRVVARWGGGGVIRRRERWLGEEELQKESKLLQPIKSRLSMRVCCSYMYSFIYF